MRKKDWWSASGLNSELVRRIVKNSSYLFSATGISGGLSFVQGILVARALGVANYGLLGTIIMFTSVINKFVSFRMNEFVIKYVGRFSEEGDDLRCAATFKVAALAEMLASVIAFSLICVSAPLGARFLAKDSSLSNWFIFYGVIVLSNLIAESSTGLLQIFDRFRRMAGLTVMQGILTLSLIALAYWTGSGLPGILGAYIAGKTLGACGLTVAAWREAGRRWGPQWWRTPVTLLRPQARELAHFAFVTNLSASLSLINKDSELLWISFFRSPLEAGYYNLALTLSNLALMPVQPLPQATYPELARETARKNWENVRLVLRRGSWMAGGYTLVVAVFLVASGPLLIRSLYAPAFLPAYPALIILLVGFLVANTFYWNRTALLALGQPGYPTRVNLVLAILKIAGIIWLVPVYGYLANAALLSGSYMLGVSLCAYQTYRILSQKEEAVPVISGIS